MALKEIKTRIASVGNTRKTTSAMKMVSSVKLRKAQQAIQYALPYSEMLDRILLRLSSVQSVRSTSELVQERQVRRVALVCFSSDSSLCGGFNANIIRYSKGLYSDLKKETGCAPMLYTVGMKITDSLQKEGLEPNTEYSGILAKRVYADAEKMADELMDLYTRHVIDKVVLAYTHFVSPGCQRITQETLLPISIPSDEQKVELDYILEPSAGELLTELLPKTVRMRLFSVMLDSYTSEQAARVIAMQAATENADSLIGELTLLYNKLRQQAITNELLDLAGSTQND